MREYGRKYYAEHRDEMQAKHRKWASENKDRVLEKSRRWRHKNRERYNQLCADTRMRLRMQVMRHYGGDPPMCACCGETELDFLTIDHINGGGRKHREVVGGGGWVLYSDIRARGYPNGLQVLCFNCNQAKGFRGMCPHMRTGGDT